MRSAKGKATDKSPSGLRNRRRDSSPGDGRRRYYDRRYEAMAVKLLPGDHYCTQDPNEMIVTVLGSCVAACIRDPKTGFGGMNHFMLPASDNYEWGGISAAMRFGNHAMETLINEIIRTGCPRERLEIKVFGGGNVIKSKRMVGHDNARFVETYLQNEGLAIDAKDLGGYRPRRIHYFPHSGSVKRLLLERTQDLEVFEAEQSPIIAPEPESEAGSIDLFTD